MIYVGKGFHLFESTFSHDAIKLADWNNFSEVAAIIDTIKSNNYLLGLNNGD